MNIWVIQIAVVVVVFAIITRLTSHASKKFDANWPPIDDDEFLRRCSPGTDRPRALRVRSIISELLGVENSQIYPEQSFVNDLDCG